MSRDFTVFAVDFDGTLCVSEWPEPNKELIKLLKFRKMQGDRLILWTCRCEERLTEAVEWCKGQGLEFDAVNENLPELIALFGGNPRKICADIYIDDKNSKVQHLCKVPFLGDEA